MLKNYVGVKLLKAEPMKHHTFLIEEKGVDPSKDMDDSPGYRVVYPDGYISWSPKDQFEKCYMQVSDQNKITQQNVDNFISKVDVDTYGEKTTTVYATLNNRFVITASSSCVDPANYDPELGEEICLREIKGKIWELLGFVLQCGLDGVKKEVDDRTAQEVFDDDLKELAKDVEDVGGMSEFAKQPTKIGEDNLSGLLSSKKSIDEQIDRAVEEGMQKVTDKILKKVRRGDRL